MNSALRALHTKALERVRDRATRVSRRARNGSGLAIRRATLRSALLAIIVTVPLLFVPCHARKLALLVGVSSYAGLAPADALHGPGPDVSLMRDEVLPLLGFGQNDVTVIADGIPGSASPSRATIRNEIDRLTTTATKGDFALIYLAGHGSSQPADPDEYGDRSLDTLNAVFLPADAKASAKDGYFDNAILNHEIAGWIKALRSKGVFVWLVVDACYSGYIDRALIAGLPVHDRGVAPANRAASTRAVTPQSTRGVKTVRGLEIPLDQRDNDDAESGYVGFFAAQADQKTIEYPMPDASSDVHGLFTYTLAHVIELNPASAFAQFRDAVLRAYSIANLRQPTPMVVGTQLDSTISGASKPVRQWRIASDANKADLFIRAGQLNGIQDGAVLSVLDDALAADSQRKGFVTVTTASATKSLVAPVEYQGVAPLKPDAIDQAFARLVAPSTPLTLRVGPAASASGRGNGQDMTNLLNAVRAEADRDPESSIHVTWVDPAASARDVTLVIDGGKLWFAGPDGSYDRSSERQTYSLDMTTHPETMALAVWNTLQRIARATNLERVASGEFVAPADLDVSVTIRRASDNKEVSVPIGGVLDVAAGDKFELLLQNYSNQPIDATVLYIDAAYNVHCLFPDEGGSPHLIAGIGIKSVNGAFNDETTGFEHLLIITGITPIGQRPLDYSYLANAPMNAHRDLQGSGLGDILSQAAFGRMGMRSVRSVAGGPSDEWIGSLTFRVARR